MKRLILAAAIVAISPQGRADQAPVNRYAPTENLEHVDMAL